MKFSAIALAVLVGFSCGAQTNTNPVIVVVPSSPTNAAVTLVTSGVSTNGASTNTAVLSKDTAAVSSGGATLKPNATADSAVHSNFTISSAWLVIVVPLVIAALKLAVPKIPSSWLPIIAPLLGVLGDGLTSYFSGNPVNPTLGALYGAAGVGIREVIDQVKADAVAKAAAPTPAPLPPVLTHLPPTPPPANPPL
jgi:hypothetical protein